MLSDLWYELVRLELPISIPGFDLCTSTDIKSEETSRRKKGSNLNPFSVVFMETEVIECTGHQVQTSRILRAIVIEHAAMTLPASLRIASLDQRNLHLLGHEKRRTVR